MVVASRIAAWWRRALKTRPVVTNTVIFASFFSAAELSQQYYNKLNSPGNPNMDLTSAAKIVTAGSALYPTSLYYWYRYLDRVLPGTALKTVVRKVAIDQFFMTPILMAGFFTLLGIMEHRDDVFRELRAKYLKTLAANQAFWIPASSINFFFMPPNLRVVYVASASFIWINVLCFIKRQKSPKAGENS